MPRTKAEQAKKHPNSKPQAPRSRSKAGHRHYNKKRRSMT